MITHRLLNKGDIAPGFDADIVLADPHETFIARAAASESRQGSGTHARQQIFALRGRSDLPPAQSYSQVPLGAPCANGLANRMLDLRRQDKEVETYRTNVRMPLLPPSSIGIRASRFQVGQPS